MARRARGVGVEENGVVHVLNRGNGRQRIFFKDGDFASFVKLLEEARKRSGMRILGYCLMDNHWHLVLRPKEAKQLSSFIGWLCSTHVRRWREHRGNSGEGHLYQGRFKSFPVQAEEWHFLAVMRYLEGNPKRAKMVAKAREWAWSSLRGAAGSEGVRVELSEWPVEKPKDWGARVERELDEEVVERLRLSVKRGRPFGEERWVKRAVKRLGMESSVRDPWRPRKTKKSKGKSG